MITYDDKVKTIDLPNPPNEKWREVDANEVKEVVNTHLTDVANPHSVTAAQVGLGNVDNTSDADKPVSTAQATAIGVVQSDIDTHELNTSNPHSVTKSQVGLSNVDNVQQQPIDSDLTAIAALTPADDDFLQRKAGAWTNRTIAQVSTDFNTVVTVTGTDTLDNTDLNKVILCSGTSADYTINLPTAVGITGSWFHFVGVTALTKIITVDANGGETINGIATRQFSFRGGFKIISNGANWEVFEERLSSIPYTPASVTGFSGTPLVSCRYSLQGTRMTIGYSIGAPSTASGTGLTFSIPAGFSALFSFAHYSRVVSNGTFQSTGMAEVSGSTVTCYLNGAGGLLAATSTKAAYGTITFDIS